MIKFSRPGLKPGPLKPKPKLILTQFQGLTLLTPSLVESSRPPCNWIFTMSPRLRDGNFKVTDGIPSLIRVEGNKGHYRDARLGEMKELDIEYGQVQKLCKFLS